MQKNFPSVPFLQTGYGKKKKNTQGKKNNITSLAASLHVIVTASWCHHQPWHFIHTEHLWAHHICFSIQCIFKCFPGNCFNTICFLGNLVPTNAMPSSLVLFLGLPILAHKCHDLIFYLQPHRYWCVLILEKGRLNWQDELCTGNGFPWKDNVTYS